LHYFNLHTICITFLDCQQKDKKYNAIDVKKITNESILEPYASSVTPFKDANQIGIRKHKTFAKEEDIKTMMDILPIDSDVKNLLTTIRNRCNIKV